MWVVLYDCPKKSNSTLDPAYPGPGLVDGGRSLKGVLMAGCSVLRPIIQFSKNVFDSTPMGTPCEYNYAKISKFDRYYKIEDWTYSGDGFWIATMRVDVLASYKSQIGNSEQYVVRCASDCDPNLHDTVYPIKSDYTSVNSFITFGDNTWVAWSNSLNPESRYRYCIGVLNSVGGTLGAVTYYTLTQAQMSDFMQYLMGSPNWLNVSDISGELLQSLFNPMQYIVSCKMFPADFESYAGLNDSVIEKIKYGWWELPVYGRRVVKPSITYIPQFHIELEPHPDSVDEHLFYLDNAPYTSHVCYLEPFGKFELPTSKPGHMGFDGLLSVDLVSGRGVLHIRDAIDDTTLIYKEGVIGTDVQLAQITTDLIGVGRTLADTFSALSASKDVGSFLGNFASGVMSSVDAITPVAETQGLNSGVLPFRLRPKVESRYYKVAHRDPDRFGMPLCRNKRISNCTGFVLCTNPHIEISQALQTEIEEIEEHMKTGFYYE